MTDIGTRQLHAAEAEIARLRATNARLRKMVEVMRDDLAFLSQSEYVHYDPALLAEVDATLSELDLPSQGPT